jgi:cellulose synthase/poly-beta-1,6-N-acetylglucosamine synthase-like glycosyltransferase
MRDVQNALNYARDAENSALKNVQLPKVSVLIVTHNDERTIEKCLKSIASQDYSNLEIIIVDAQSGDSSVQIASKYATKIIKLKSNVLGRSRQISVANSSGILLAILDADVVVPSNWISTAVSKFKRGVGIAWSFNEPPSNSSIVARGFFSFWREILSYRIQSGRGPIAGSNSMYLREAVDAVGGFDEKSHYSEDIDLGSRIQELGYSIAILEVPIIHDTMRSLGKYTRNQLWAARDFSKHGLHHSRLSMQDIAYEHIFLGSRGFIKGLFAKRDFSWLVFPLLLFIRVYAYSITFFINRTNRF